MQTRGTHFYGERNDTGRSKRDAAAAGRSTAARRCGAAVASHRVAVNVHCTQHLRALSLHICRSDRCAHHADLKDCERDNEQQPGGRCPSQTAVETAGVAYVHTADPAERWRLPNASDPRARMRRQALAARCTDRCCAAASAVVHQRDRPHRSSLLSCLSLLLLPPSVAVHFGVAAAEWRAADRGCAARRCPWRRQMAGGWRAEGGGR